MGEFGVESFYGGGGSSFDPSPDGPFVGYQLNPTTIGFATNPMTPEQLNEFQRGVRSGAKVIEINLNNLQGEVHQQVPTQHLQEMRALSKITGISPSIHGPLVDAAGFSEQRGIWSEENRDQNERIMFAAMEKAKIVDPDKNIPVVFHSSNMLGGGTLYTPEKKDGKTIFKEEVVPIYNRATKQLDPVTEKKRYHIGGGDTDDPKNSQPFEYTPTADETIEIRNSTSWQNEIKSLTLEKKYGDDILKDTVNSAYGRFAIQGKPLPGPITNEDIGNAEGEFGNGLNKADIILSNSRAAFNSLFEQAYEYGTSEQQKELKTMSDNFGSEQANFQKKLKEESKMDAKDRTIGPGMDLVVRSEMQDKYLQKMLQITGREAPKTFIRAETFAMDEAAKTFGNVATRSFNELGAGSAPVIAIENVWNGAMFSRGKDMKNLVLKSREVMTKNLMEDGMEKDVAKDVAKKQIGMNFDLGHFNMFRKKGFTTEDMAGEVKEFAEYINYMHITDNFGFSDEHFYPGQGNVPFKEFFREIAKKHPDIHSFKKIVESGGIEHRNMGGRSAHAFNLAAFGVPIFGANSYGSGMAPTFDRGLDTVGAYFGGYGDTSPSIHHSLYGAGFTTLPGSFGGIMPGADTGRSRFGGTPMS
ncbi:MAG: sugar phosphate isomerase/epimerase [Nanoarchaeota archaeon]|nr:sugar phosphate isomerase/epimerase [Nanoarchaeota archaeon]